MLRILEKDYANALYEAYRQKYKYVAGSDSNFDAVVIQAVADVLRKYPPTAIPVLGDDQRATTPVTALAAGASVADLRGVMAKPGTPSYSVVLLKEDHGSATDIARGNNVLAALSTHPATLSASMVVFERAMGYPTPSEDVTYSVREEVICKPDNLPVTEFVPPPSAPGAAPRNTRSCAVSQFCLGLSDAQRSMVIAGYMAACAGAGPQSGRTSFLVLFGANHQDIFKYFDKFVSQSGVTHMMKVPRTFVCVQSSV